MLSATAEHGLAPTGQREINVGDDFTYDGADETLTARATDGGGITFPGGRVAWDAPGLRKVDPLTPALDTPLTGEERERLAELEDTVNRTIKSVREGHEALDEIQERRLYRESHGTFAAYAQDRWGLKPAYAYQRLQAGRDDKRMEASGFSEDQRPQRESVFRELRRLPEEQRDEAWQEALARTPRGRGDEVTAGALKELVDARLPKREPVISPEADLVKQGGPESGANLTSVEQAPETSANCGQTEPDEQLQIPDKERAPEFDYRGWEIGNATEWTDQTTGDVRQGVVNNLWNGQVVVLPSDGKPPQGGLPLAPELLRRPASSAPETKPAVVKSAAEIAAERAAARTTKPGVLKSAEDKVQERHAPKEPPPAPEGWDGKPVMAIIPAALAGRLDQTGAIPVQAVSTYCDLWDLTTKHRVEPEAAVELLDRFLVYCQRLGRTPESVLGEADEYVQEQEAAAEAGDEA